MFKARLTLTIGTLLIAVLFWTQGIQPPPGPTPTTVEASATVVFVVDASAASGPQMKVMRQEVTSRIARLGHSQDRFDLVLFRREGIEVCWPDGPALIVKDNAAKLLGMLDTAKAEGPRASPIPALKRALELAGHSRVAHASSFVLLTTGSFDDSDAAYTAKDGKSYKGDKAVAMCLRENNTIGPEFLVGGALGEVLLFASGDVDKQTQEALAAIAYSRTEFKIIKTATTSSSTSTSAPTTR
jgi:hypothetical protein